MAHWLVENRFTLSCTTPIRRFAPPSPQGGRQCIANPHRLNMQAMPFDQSPVPLTRHHIPPRQPLRQSAGRSLRVTAEESPGSMETRWRLTAAGGDPRDSATEKKPLSFEAARVKRCGKSAPRDRQRNRQGKPHREQNRIGTAWRRKTASLGFRPPSGLVASGGTQVLSQMNDRHAGATRPYRTRLTGRLTPLTD